MSEIDYKKCKTCNTEKPLSDFYIRKETGKHRTNCISCQVEKSVKWRKENWGKYKETVSVYNEVNKEKKQAYQKEYGIKNSEKRNAYAKEYYNNNKDKANEQKRLNYIKKRGFYLEKGKKWYQENKEKHAAKRSEYESNNKDRLRAARRKWENNRLATDINYKLHKNLAGRIREELNGKKKRTDRTEILLGCTIDELKVFIQNQFTDGMSWDNWSTNGWHIDHRIPLSWFNLENENCRKLAFSYKNLQPLWSEDNLEKKNFYAHKLAS